ncbi:hypothetical protein BDV93DRAFT_508389 [Ceratobasidium sp. AG-I]|nr:hypothetical protein BDV93DRAFT_508389 [Ceratobasidium sp. AG-I]
MPVVDNVRAWLNQNIKWKADRERERGREHFQLDVPALIPRRDDRERECQHYHRHIHDHSQHLSIYVYQENNYNRQPRSKSQALDGSRSRTVIIPDRGTAMTYSGRSRTLTLHGGSRLDTSHAGSSSQQTLVNQELLGSRHSHSRHQGSSGKSRDGQLIRADTRHGSSEGRTRRAESTRERGSSRVETDQGSKTRSRSHYICE